MGKEKLGHIKKDSDDVTDSYISFKSGITTYVRIPKGIGYLIHEETDTKITVYSSISLFKRLMLKWCFGLKYKKVPKSIN